MKDNLEEIFPLVDEEGTVVGKATRGECHNGSRLLHAVVHLHIFNSQGEVYLQKRPEWKDIQPGKWDTAVGGHIDYGETPEEALRREVREELGITDFEPQFIGKYVFDSKRERELVYVNRTTYDGEIRPSKDELDGGRFWSMQEIRESIGQGVLTPNFESEFQRFFTPFSKLQPVKQRRERACVFRARSERRFVRERFQRHIRKYCAQLIAQICQIFVFRQPGSEAVAGDVGQARIHPVKRTAGSDELCRGLWPDSRHARDIVRTVALQRFQIYQLLRGQSAVHFRHFCPVVQHVFPVARQHNVGAVADQLQRVPVSRQDHRMRPSCSAEFCRQRAKYVVRLVPRKFKSGNTHPVKQFFQQRHLRRQIFRHRFSGAFVFLI